MSATTTSTEYLASIYPGKVTAAIIRVEDKLADLDAEAVAKLETTATLDFEEYLAFGPYPSEMMVTGLIGANDAQVLHFIHQDFDGASMGARIVFLQIMAEYLDRKIGASR
jgi:hypothetical protein